MMRAFCAVKAVLIAVAIAALNAAALAADTAPATHRYLVKRAGSAVVIREADGKFGVKLLTSYGTPDHSGSYWVYEAPDFSAVESAAKASGVPFESIVEIPETVYPY